MSYRLPRGGRLIDRSRTVHFRFDGVSLTGHPGDTLASALLAEGRILQGRSFKYHRPRGPVTADSSEPNALVGLGEGPSFEPNVRTPSVPLSEGLVAESQNRWPSLAFDIGRISDRLAKLLPAGFYYKTFLWPRGFWKHVYEPLIRRAAGLGRPPEGPDPDSYEQLHAFADVVVAGGGVAGLAAARAAAATGARVIVMEETGNWGGRAAVDGTEVDGLPAAEWVAKTVTALSDMANVTLRLNCSVTAVHDHGYVLADEWPRDAGAAAQAPRQRLWRIRAGRVVAANGAIERPLAFAGNDRPGVMLASAMRDYVVNHAVAPGRRVVVVTNNDDAYRTALMLADAGVEVAAVVDARDDLRGDLPQAVRARGIPVHDGSAIERVHGHLTVHDVTLCRIDGDGACITARIGCDAVAMSGGWSPAVHLWSHAGGKLAWDEANVMFRPDPRHGPTGHDGAVVVIPAGGAAGALWHPNAVASGHAAGVRAAAETGHSSDRTAPAAPVAAAEEEGATRPVWIMPEGAGSALRSQMFIDFQNDVKVTDIELAALEGFESVEHAKRYTTLGMATDQGKLSNINGLAVLAAARGSGIAQTGTTTFRPPWTPLTLGAIAGEATGALFQPVRRTPMQDWHALHGAHWEPVGLWRRPYAYVRPGETRSKAVMREVLNTRQTVGILDASTLGKILVRGPDAGRFLDMLYTGTMSTLPPGRCRYGVMCTENGFVFDDGVVARIDEQTWLCHTTTGGADRVHGWMEDWLQCEWWGWKVHVVNLTEAIAQVAIAGPNARRVLGKLGGLDLSADALGHMHWSAGRLGDFDARVLRVSFSGELGFEVAVPARQGPALWDRLMAAGTEFGIMAYGTEALHVMRAEKGFIMIGDETDGTVTPGDLGLPNGAKKADFLGKRGLARPHLRDPDRWRLVGLETLTGSVLPHGAYAASGAYTDTYQRAAEGRVTSSYYSPTLGRGIALGLVRRGPERMGEVLTFPVGQAAQMRARIVSPVFYDPQGERLHV
ncbi:MAG: sarcosine oxidase subunit alpha family protein [Alkalilacustris sp.]